jgi:hypothetical protein
MTDTYRKCINRVIGYEGINKCINNVIRYDNSNIEYGINISLHILILITFLTVFFFSYISKLTEKQLKKELNSTIEKQTTHILDKFDKLTSSNVPIDWKMVDEEADKIIQKYNEKIPEIIKNNKKVFKTSMYSIAFLCILFIGSVIYFKYYKKYNIDLSHIITENVILFSFIGVLEYLFFSKIASKYVPITPDFIQNTILDRIKYIVDRSIYPDSS